MANIGARIERIPDNKYNRKMLIRTGFGNTFDSMDIAMVAFVLPSLIGLWSLTSEQAGILGSSVLIGYFFGAFFSGWLGDKIGRKKVIMYTLVIYCLATLASAFAAEWEHFFWMRVIAGIGTGGESAILAPYLSELIASRYRGKYIGALTGFHSFGYVAAAVIGYFVIPMSEDWGWRIALIITALPIFLVLYWRRTLPESPRWLESSGRLEEAEKEMSRMEANVEKYIGKLPEPTEFVQPPKAKGSFFTLWNKKFVKRTVMVWILWFSVIFSYYGFFTWLPTLLYNEGFEISKSFMFSILIYLAQIPGYFSAAFLNDKIGRKKVICAYLGLGAVSALFLSQADTSTTIIIAGFFTSLFMVGGMAGMYTYTPEQYPTIIRSTGTGSASAFGRIGGLLAPIYIGFMYPIYGFIGVFLMTTGVLLVGMLSTLILGEETNSKPLDDLTADDDDINKVG
ncbi:MULTISPECIES: MFS transporter [Bacillaceae]|uniref:MFS transporter n=1 Tax=Peribacillus huizhouensis TaxID=1501239 RepID=A0ABR6CXG8_9BACI|nr:MULTISPECIES: MFS transporter [Bacillaceae]MBA9029406.1 putative MFS transporter [Peribacillus huizhouensis]